MFAYVMTFVGGVFVGTFLAVGLVALVTANDDERDGD